jgi:hypothetical protein
MSTPAHISANFLNVQKSTGSRTAACDYARNHLSTFGPFSTSLNQLPSTYHTAYSSQQFMAMSLVFIKSTKKRTQYKKCNSGPMASQNLQIPLIFRNFLSRYSRCLGAKMRKKSPERTQFMTAFKLNSINRLTRVFKNRKSKKRTQF